MFDGLMGSCWCMVVAVAEKEDPDQDLYFDLYLVVNGQAVRGLGPIMAWAVVVIVVRMMNDEGGRK